MTLKAKIKKLEEKMTFLRYQKKEIAIIRGCYSCRSLGLIHGDECCEHEQQNLDKWIAEHEGNEPDMIIRIIGVPGKQRE